MAENQNFMEYFKRGLLKADENGVVNVVFDPEERAAIEASYSANEAQSEQYSQQQQQEVEMIPANNGSSLIQ